MLSLSWNLNRHSTLNTDDDAEKMQTIGEAVKYIGETRQIS